jgi:hypothetical protein
VLEDGLDVVRFVAPRTFILGLDRNLHASLTHARSVFAIVVNFSEVEAANQPAVQLYRKFGFEPQENPNWRSKNIFMVKEL